MGPLPQGVICLQQQWAVQIRIFMHHSIPDEFRLFQTRDQSEHPFLFRPFQMGLEANDIVQGPGSIILAQLDHRIGVFPCPRVGQPHRFQRPKAHGIFSPQGHFLDGHAGFEHIMFKIFHWGRFCLAQFLPEPEVFFFIERTVVIGGFPLIIPGSFVHLVLIQGIHRHDGRRRIEEMEIILMDQLLDSF